MTSELIKNHINSDSFEELIKNVYCSNEKEVIETQRKRYLKVIDEAVKLYGDGEYHIISSPGRVEIGGNHTDHQRGNVVAASINIDNVCAVKKTSDNIVIYKDNLFGENSVDLSDLSIHEEEKNNTKSIMRGMAARYKSLGHKIGGFRAYQDTKVLPGSGLSSSACFEVLIAEIFNYFFNDEKVCAVDNAKISQWVENNYFGKPCGLMDQMAIAVGSFVSIDFFDKDNPKIEQHNFRFGDFEYQLLVINTKANHSDLTEEYAAIPKEMEEIAKYYNVEVLSQVDENRFYKDIKTLREKIKNDRAILRAHHYFMENKKAKDLKEAIKNKSIKEVLSIMSASGDSSYMYLQNVYAATDTKNQAISIAISLSKKYVENNGISRVQGGGFAGTIQVVVKKEKANNFIKEIKNIFGEDSIMPVEIRNVGTKVII